MPGDGKTEIGLAYAEMMLPKIRMNSSARSLSLLGLSCIAFSWACAPPERAVDSEPGTSAATDEPGTLQLVANGEDFVRQGFVSKDGWRIDFDRVAVTLANVEAYQTEPAFDPDGDAPLQALQTVSLVGAPKTIDLAAGDADALPIAVTETTAPEGFYNALAWQLVSDSEGNSLVIAGTAQKEGRALDFVLEFGNELSYSCGEFVGDERKGILAAGGSTELETTFHFDHIFGDGDAPPDDEINTGALGFTPLAKLATGDTLSIDLAALKAALAPEEYATLEEAIAGLGHVGEGHCRQEK